MARYQPVPCSSRSHDYPSSSSSVSTSPTSAMDPDKFDALQRTEGRISEILAQIADPHTRDEDLDALRDDLGVVTREAADLRVRHLSWNPLGDFRLSSPKRKSPVESFGQKYQSIFWDARQGIGKYAHKSQPQRASTRHVANAPGKGEAVKRGRPAKNTVKVAGKTSKPSDRIGIFSAAAPVLPEPAAVPVIAPALQELQIIPEVIPALQESDHVRAELHIDEVVPPTPKRRRVAKVHPEYVTLDILDKEPALHLHSELSQPAVVLFPSKRPSDSHVPQVMQKHATSRLIAVNDAKARKKSVPSAEPKPVQKRKYTKKDTNLYCVCREISHGKMVACDNEECAVGWFHFGCVGLKRAPVGLWFCPECRDGKDATTRKGGKSISVAK